MSFADTLAQALAAPGRQAIPFTDHEGDATRPLVLHTYRPAQATPDSPVVLVQHGMMRNGDDYRDFWIPAADKHGLLIVAPNFDNANYPGAEVYNNGHVLAADSTVRPRAEWGYAVPERVFHWLRKAGVTRREKAYFYGHSAGGQFGHRMASTQPLDIFEAIAVGNPGWYTLPTLEKTFPEGLGGIGLGEAELLRLLAFPLLILAGEQDIETSGPSLPAQPEAVAQGPHRFARAKNYLAAGQAEAARRGVACNWTLVQVPHIGHDGDVISRVAASLWFDRTMPDDATLAGWAKGRGSAL
ncbi:alpha/beta hydrolase [Roseomonas marmotae]|uniref:Alpha/beta hydrolase n=1 Tax=Roseomonas marmotae TaxID=2768161 RepID=A0ABS3K9Y9_9PROT|nr:alpha/beta hydrolase [Roseomonas marmotae]MBO1073458.1 alpha/beta hydrolase [Roseomonas marmotae]QTI80347.1 alpha/beta hydrolase [Roseomonas marmotae]